MTESSNGRPKPSQKRQHREAQLIEAATTIFSREGYSAASIQTIADAVGMLKGSLYHYIGSKEDLLYAIFDQAHREAEALMAATASMDAPAAERLTFYVRNVVLNALGDLDRTSLYFRDWRHLTGDRFDALVKQRKEYAAFMRTLVKDVFAEAGVEPTIDSKLVSFFVLGGINWLADWYRPEGPDSASTVADSYAQLVLSALDGATPRPLVFPVPGDAAPA